MYTKSISLFGVAVIEKTNPSTQIAVAKEAFKLGYIVEPLCATSDVLNWLKAQKADFNSTFYKTFQDVISKSRFELFLDQIRHYLSTYGTDFAEGNGYVPNDGERPEFDFTSYKVIKAVTLFQLCDRCFDLIKSGIALKTEDVNFCVELSYEKLKRLNKVTICATLEEIKNKEAQAALYAQFDLAPREKFALIRYISQKQLGTSMIIQNKETIGKIRSSVNKFNFRKLDDKQIEELSSIFLRYKNWFLAFKNKTNSRVINKMRRLANHTHKPLVPSFWDTLLAKYPDLEIVKKKLSEIDNFRKIRLYMACREKLNATEYRGFLVRNQKFYYKKELNFQFYEDYYEKLSYLIAGSLPYKKVKLPKNFRLAFPSSEKSFMGNMPLGTQFWFGHSNGFLGIYWRKEWGARDFDLHYFDANGKHIGWNSDYYDDGKSPIYSGDMTNADPEASEVMFLPKECPEGFISACLYNGNSDSRFDVIMGNSTFDPHKNSTASKSQCYIVDPNLIKFRAECHAFSRESTCGYVFNNTFTLMNFRTGNKQVPGNPELVKIMAQKAKSFLYLDEVFEIVPEDYEGDDYTDLTGDLKVDDIINLLK